MKLAFIGIGNVGFAIADNLQKKGHQIILANDDGNSETASKALAKNPNFVVKKVQQAVNEAEAVFLATPFNASEEILTGLGISCAQYDTNLILNSSPNRVTVHPRLYFTFKFNNKVPRTTLAKRTAYPAGGQS